MNYLFGGSRNNNRINKVFGADTTRGNTLLAGWAPDAMKRVISLTESDALNRNQAVVVFRGIQNGYTSFPSAVRSPMQMFEINNEEGAVTEKIDPFADFSDAEIDSYLVRLFGLYNEVDNGKRIIYQRYISIIRRLLASEKKTIKPEKLFEYDVFNLLNLNATARISEIERTNNERFLNSFIPDSRDLESYFYVFSHDKIGEILSGSRSIGDILGKKSALEISLDFANKRKESEMLMSVVVDCLYKTLNCWSTDKDSVLVIADDIPNEGLIRSDFEKLIKFGDKCRVIYTSSDVAGLIEKSSNNWIEYCDNFFFFVQNSNKNKEYCSKFFGEYDKRKESKSTSVNQPTFFDRLSGRGIVTRQTGKTVSYEKEAVYPTSVFSSLGPNEAIYYSKHTRKHGKYTVR